MKTIILAAGKGTRMGDVSLVTPKPMQKVLGKTLIEHKLDDLPEEISEIIIVVGHLKNKITESLGENYGHRKITYIIQVEQKGTADAIFLCKDLLKGEEKFLVMNGDDIYSKDDMEECLRYPFAILIREVDSIKGKGKIIFDDKGFITNIVEKPMEEIPGFVNTGLYVLTPKIFDYEMVSIGSGEFGLPQTILSAKNDINIHAVQARFWLQVTTPADLEIAETFLKIK